MKKNFKLNMGKFFDLNFSSFYLASLYSLFYEILSGKFIKFPSFGFFFYGFSHFLSVDVHSPWLRWAENRMMKKSFSFIKSTSSSSSLRNEFFFKREFQKFRGRHITHQSVCEGSSLYVTIIWMCAFNNHINVVIFFRLIAFFSSLAVA
jgi:hypothetical protein